MLLAIYLNLQVNFACAHIRRTDVENKSIIELFLFVFRFAQKR